MLHRIDIDSLMCLVGGCLVGVGTYFDTLLPAELSVEAVLAAESKSILEIQFKITEALHVTPADVIQVVGAFLGLVGFCNLVCKRVKTWYNSRKLSEN